jgi:AraC-like DNA-binding protein
MRIVPPRDLAAADATAGAEDSQCVKVPIRYAIVLKHASWRYAHRVDVLSDTITAMRTGQPHSARSGLTGPFARRHPAVPGAGFHVVLQGSAWLYPADGAPVELREGDVAFLPHGSPHGLTDDPSTPLPGHTSALPPAGAADPPPPAAAATTVLLCGAYLLERSRAHPVLDDLPDVVHLPTTVGRHPGLRGAVDLLGAELDRPRPGADAMVTALLDVLLLHILRAWLDDRAATGRPTGWAAALADPPVAAALRAVHAEPARAWTVAELGTRAGLSRSAFARRFTALVGRPPLAYLTWWRMALAARRLRAGGAPVAAVAREVGYGSEFAFAAAFKREFGTPPGAYRRTSAAAVLDPARTSG